MRRNIPFLIICGGGFRLREWGFYVLKRRRLISLHSDLGTRVEYGFFDKRVNILCTKRRKQVQKWVF